MSERQESQLESDAVEVDFAALSIASSLDCLRDHSAAITEAFKTVSDARRQGNEQDIVSSFAATAARLASAVRRACELLGDLAVLQGGTAPAEPLVHDDEVPGCVQAGHLMALLGQQLWLNSWLSREPLGAGLLVPDRTKLKIAQDIASSGLLSPLARLGDMVSGSLIQQQGLRSEVETVVCGLINLAAGLLAQWPGRWYSGRTLAPALPSLLRLLVSALSSSRSSSWLDGYMGATLSQLIAHIHRELDSFANAVTDRQLDRLISLPSETVDILQSPTVQHLPLLAVASLVEQLYEHKYGAGESGSSSSTQRQQRQQVAAAHAELHRAIGLCKCPILSHRISLDSPEVLDLLVGLICSSIIMLTCQEGVQARFRIINSSSNSSNSGSLQQQHEEMLVRPKVCYALLLVAVEVMELHPGDCILAAAMLTCIESLVKLLDLQLSVATTIAAAPRLSGSVLAADRNAAEAFGYMQRSFEVVLLQLIPVVTQSLRITAGATGGSNEGDSSSNSGVILCSKSLTPLLQRVLTDRWIPNTSSDAPAVMTACQQNPATTLSSLEAGLRLLARAAASATQKVYHQGVLLFFLATLASDLRAMMSQQTAIKADPEQQQQQQQKVISLVISMLKCCKLLSDCDEEAWQMIGLVTLVLEASLLVAAAAAGSSNLAGVSNPPESITTVEASMQTHGLVFAGRCLMVVADFLELSTSSKSDHLQELLPPQLCLDIRTMLPQVTAAVKLLQQQLAASASTGSTSAPEEVLATAVQTLQQQASSLQDSLAAAQGAWQELLQQPLPQTEEVPGSPGVFELVPDGQTRAYLALALIKVGFGASGEVAQQLTDFAAAVCNAVPVPCCCNNPDCDNLSQASDSELVSGKSCVCARCEVARYCGRECQTAHWPQHKAACNRIKASKKA